MDKDLEQNRKDFLMKIYDQMFNDIDRHHKFVWENIGILIGAFAVFALTEKNLIPFDFAVAIIILISSWVIMQVYDSNYWYNRNLVIIANIERQFLTKEDLKHVHYYFGAHRPVNSVQTTLKIQIYFCWTIIVLFLVYHFITAVIPSFHFEWNIQNVDLAKTIPYLVTLICFLGPIKWIKKKRRDNYKEFLAESPGVHVDVKGTRFGDGHGH